MRPSVGVADRHRDRRAGVDDVHARARGRRSSPSRPRAPVVAEVLLHLECRGAADDLGDLLRDLRLTGAVVGAA
jgi:hypothetical protein